MIIKASTQFLTFIVLYVAFCGIAQAQSLADKLRDRLKETSQTASSSSSTVSQNDAGAGIKEALAQGVNRSITRLGRPDGFLKDQVAKVLVPKKMRTVADAARKLGASRYVDEFELSMNRAAEKAVPQAADIFADAVRQMTVSDALNIVRGGDTAGTDFFRRVTQDKLRGKFMSIVAKSTAEFGVTQRYKTMTDRGGGKLGALLGGGGSKSLDLDGYVTDQAMNGLFHYIGEHERSIRQNPASRTTDLLRRVFKK